MFSCRNTWYIWQLVNTKIRAQIKDNRDAFFFFTADLEIHYIAITDFQITPV